MSASEPRGLPAQRYYAPECFRLEIERVFAREWSYVAPARALEGRERWICEPHPVAGLPIFLTRDRHGEAHAFVNACLHRGAPIRPPGEGSARELRCPYHGWVYGLDGSLRAARDFGDRASTAGLSLRRVDVAEWRGLLFVRVASTGPSLLESLGDLPRVAQGSQSEGWERAARRELEIACNWKVYVENYNEGYHIPLLHPELAGALDMGTYRVENANRVCVHRCQSRGGSAYCGVSFGVFPTPPWASTATG